MASELTVQTLRGPASGANANTVLVPSGQTLHAPGHVIQVIHNGTTTGVTNNTQTFIDTSLQAGITPQFATSKILVLINQNIHKYGGYIDQMQLRITRDNTPILTWATEVLHDNGALTHFDIFASQTYLDSPSTTSEVTYRTQFRRRLTTSASMQVQYAGSRSSITVMEIAQ
jgi:hypothetical protein